MASGKNNNEKKKETKVVSKNNNSQDKKSSSKTKKVTSTEPKKNNNNQNSKKSESVKKVSTSKRNDNVKKAKTVSINKNTEDVQNKKEELNKNKENLVKTTTNNKEEKTIDIKLVDNEIENKLEQIKEKKSDDLKTKSNTNKEFSLFEVILMIIITILTCILVGYFLKPDNKDDVKNDNNIADNEIKTFLEQYNYILDNYYGDIDKKQLINDAIEGMFSSLDDYSQVIDQESNSFTITLQGEYEGVGIVIANDIYGNIVIQEVYENTPAYKSGIRANDVLIKFNEESLSGKTTSELVAMIAAANEMNLTVLRDEKEITVTVKREKIVLESVKHQMLKNNIGYIDVDIFAANTTEQFEKALVELENKNMKSLIIDLRDNTGGHLSVVENMLYLFLDNTHIIYQTEDKNGVEKTYSNGTNDKEYKIVILQNGFSASASEIMAAALNEELGAYIIGNTSFGKGTVQTLKDVNGDIQYKFTTKRWLTPKGNWVNGVGVKPNMEVILSEEYYNEPTLENDNQLNAAIDYLNK